VSLLSPFSLEPRISRCPGALRVYDSTACKRTRDTCISIGAAEYGDSSQNVWWLGPLQLTAWEENWHRNHHTYSGSARFGLRWWQVDVGWYVINLLEAVGLAGNVKRPSRKAA